MGIVGLAEKALVVVATSLGMLHPTDNSALSTTLESDNSRNIAFQQYKNKKAKPSLVLKLNMRNPEASILLSHSSHSSHSSHRSHYSSGSGDGGGGGGVGLVLVGGVLAYGAYKLGQKSNDKNDNQPK